MIPTQRPSAQDASPRDAWTVPIGAVAMGSIVYASNRLVEIPINDWLTWGAFTYPFAFLVTDVVNRRAGTGAALKVVSVGFLIGVALSLLGADLRIAIASGTAFLIAQSLDVQIFDRLRARHWWIAPGVSSTLGSMLDTLLFFGIAFAGTGLPWAQWALGDLAVKLLMVWVALLPYRWLVAALPQARRC